jgi:hypothetical protein
MYKLVAVSLLAVASSSAFAWGDREQGALAGAVIGFIIGQNQPRQYVHPAPVYQPPAHVPGIVYRDYTYRPMYKAVDIYIPECNCTRTVMVQVN